MGHPGDCGVPPSLKSLGLMTGERANLMAQWGTASIVGVRRGVGEEWGMAEQEALRRVLVRKGLLTNEEVLEEIKAVRREMEGKRP